MDSVRTYNWSEATLVKRTFMTTIKTAKKNSSRTVNALCASVEDLGVMPTKFGPKPMLRFTFESDEVNEFGDKKRYTRLFHKHGHEKSSLSVAMKGWTGCDLVHDADEIDEVNWKAFEKLPASLTLEPGNVVNGKQYCNIIEISGVKAEPAKPEPEPVIEIQDEITEPKDNE
jgi:hypothetical protein